VADPGLRAAAATTVEPGGSGSERVLFDEVAWRDPLTGVRLQPVVTARTPAGVPICGALKRPDSDEGYPIVDCVVRLTPELAGQHRAWLAPLQLRPPGEAGPEALQAVDTVDSFGWQWAWAGNMRSDTDLEWRVARRFGVETAQFAGRIVLDAGAGAGDQSVYLSRFADGVVSIDLSNAIDVVASKMRMNGRWVGVQGDVTSMPFASDQFGAVYCEGVIQHTRDSAGTVRELVRVAGPASIILASHYTRRTVASPVRRAFRRATIGHYNLFRGRLSRMERYRLLLATGVLASMAYVPGLRSLVRWTGTAVYSELMPDFKTTWTNTFDKYGGHAYQRYMTPEEFWALFEEIPGVEIRTREAGSVTAIKRSGPLASGT
jgi:ubiquinone/menaquinone biosynthesis C-methylase UbiE